MATNVDYSQVVYTEKDDIYFGVILEERNGNNLLVRIDGSIELHRMSIAHDYFEQSMDEGQQIHCEHIGQTFDAIVAELITVDKFNEVLRLRLKIVT